MTSNQESGLGHYDVMLEPHYGEGAAIILEFKVFDKDEEESLEDTVNRLWCRLEVCGCAGGKGICAGTDSKV